MDCIPELCDSLQIRQNLHVNTQMKVYVQNKIKKILYMSAKFVHFLMFNPLKNAASTEACMLIYHKSSELPIVGKKSDKLRAKAIFMK